MFSFVPRKSFLILALVASVLAGCANLPGQNRYGYQDVGQVTEVEFGKVIAVRKVDITGQNSGVGAATGATAGAFAGANVGSGNGSLGAALAGVVIGAVAGHMAEQAMADHQGIEYVIRLKNKHTITVVQNVKADDVVLKKGDKCMVQTSGTYQRVLPIDDDSSK